MIEIACLVIIYGQWILDQHDLIPTIIIASIFAVLLIAITVFDVICMATDPTEPMLYNKGN